MRRLPAGEHRGDHVEQDREPGALPEADREQALRALDRGRIARELAALVVAADDGQLLPAHAVRAERAVRELRHRHVEHDVARGARHGDDERVVADERDRRAPRRDVGERVRPADADHAGVGGLPAVVAAAHPVVGVAEPHRADAVLARELDRARHAGPRVEVAGPAASVPSLHAAARRDAHGRAWTSTIRCGSWRRSAGSGSRRATRRRRDSSRRRGARTGRRGRAPSPRARSTSRSVACSSS